MGFYVMVFSAIIDVFLIDFDFLVLKTKINKPWSIVAISIGIALVLFAVWLGLPK